MNELKDGAWRCPRCERINGAAAIHDCRFCNWPGEKRGPARPDFDPHIDYPERFVEPGRPI